jgi:hypothetical protein
VLRNKSLHDGISGVIYRNAEKIERAKNANRRKRAAVKLPDAAFENTFFPAALTAFVPECAIKKFAANKPFAVHVHSGIGEHLILYLDNHPIPQDSQ